MNQVLESPYGSWKSPITSELIVRGSIGLSQIVLDSNHVYWLESRPTEQGRSVIVRKSAHGTTTDITPAPYNVRSRVHEYGGGAYAVHKGVIYFSNFSDNVVYSTTVDSSPKALTLDSNLRYTDFCVDELRRRLICIREDHREKGKEPQNAIVAIDIEGTGDGEILISGNDFYSTPRISPDGTRMFWLTWNHPNMPWDGTELWLADLSDDGQVQNQRKIAGWTEESIFQPEWSPDNLIYFVSDRTNWWNIYRMNASGETEAITSLEAEFGLPAWHFGMRTYSFLNERRLVATFLQNGTSSLVLVDVDTKDLVSIDTPYTVYEDPVATGSRVWFLGASSSVAGSLFEYDVAARSLQLLQTSVRQLVDPGYLSTPIPIEFPTTAERSAHALYYPPKNKNYVAPNDELPPLLVMSHGGPTSATFTSLNLFIQYWTSRGFGVMDVNYGGSIGYGRDYRNRLRGEWGIVDVDDCTNAALYAVEKGLVDGRRLAITGASAGGYTTLCALTFKQIFAVGASHFGISDLELMTKDTHKFESHYLDSLIGPYPERKDVYVARSPIHFLEKLSCPMVFFQGLDDMVVPPIQAELMVTALKEKGIGVAYVPFPGEGHGYRKAENIRTSLDGQLYFFSKVLGFTVPDETAKIEIFNM